MAEYEQYNDIAITDLGTQVFWFNSTSQKFEYAFPVTAGADFGGDVESYEANETDLDYTAKYTGRPSTNDIEYTLNYTYVKYSRLEDITSITNAQVYMEVFTDGSADIFRGTSAGPQIGSGDIRELTISIQPSFSEVINNVFALNEKSISYLDSLSETTGDSYYTSTALNIDIDSVPTIRQKYYVSNNSTTEIGE